MTLYESREEYLDYLHGELDATALEFATGLHEQVAQSMTETFTNALLDTMNEEELGQEFAEEGESLVLAGMRYRVYAHLSRLANLAADGWSVQLTRALNKRYPTD